jgi:hypothetical protein
MSQSETLPSLGWPKTLTIGADASALLQDLPFVAKGSMGILGQSAQLGYVVAPLVVVSETERRLLRMVGSAWCPAFGSA